MFFYSYKYTNTFPDTGIEKGFVDELIFQDILSNYPVVIWDWLCNMKAWEMARKRNKNKAI